LKDIRRQILAEYNAAIRTMASGRTKAGMEQLDALGWVREGKGHYIDQAAAAYVASSAQSARVDDCIAVTPTWAENHRLTQAIRSQLKERGLLKEGAQLSVHDPLEWTAQQKARAANFSPGMIVQFHADAGKARKGQSFIVDSAKNGHLILQGRSAPIDPARCASRFSVYRARNIELCSNDRILIRRNDRPSGLINGELLTVRKIQKDGTIETHEGKKVSPSFRTFCHGYVVTSHKSQGRTHEKVIVASEQLNAKAAYVACSRGRSQCLVYTPDKTTMLSTLNRSGDRKAAFDVLNSAAARLGTWFRDRTETICRVMTQARHDDRFVPSPMPARVIESSLRVSIQHEL
jgi:ATP-dependent exoDNAse (exonuclease V) alpha subunit